MKPDVEQAIKELRAAFPENQFSITEDAEGGAKVIIDNVVVGEGCTLYNQDTTWVGFRIAFQYPYADIYPVFVRGDLSRRDGRPLGEAMSPLNWEGQPAVQVSRRSNNRDVLLDNAVIKIQKVLRWMSMRP